MTRNQATQIARIIEDVFQHEEQIDPRTVALMFDMIGRLTHDMGETDDD